MDCQAAKSYFADRGVEFEARDITSDQEALVQLRDVIGRMATPTIVIGDEILLGFAANRARIEEILGGQQRQETSTERETRLALEADISAILKRSKTVAVVGLSSKTDRPSYGVAKYLQEQGYRIIPVNPTEDQVLGEKSYPDLASIPVDVDVVDIFRRPEHVPAVVESAIALDIPAVWMQIGVVNEAALERARSAGLLAVMDRCMQTEHARLAQEGTL